MVFEVGELEAEFVELFFELFVGGEFTGGDAGGLLGLVD